MKSRLFSTAVLALALAFSVALASDKGEKTTKQAPAKKEMKGCCSEMKSSKECSEEEMKNGESKHAKTSTKASETKPEVKPEKKTGDAK